METAKKEIFIAIIVGLMVGTIATLLYTGALKNLSNPFKQKDNSQIALISPTIPMASSKKNNDNEFISLDLVSEDNITSSSIKITGKTNPNVDLLISTESDDILIKSDGSGNFKKEITLIPGSNKILVANPNSLNDVSKEITIFSFPDSL